MAVAGIGQKGMFRRTPLLCSLATLRGSYGVRCSLPISGALTVARSLCRGGLISCPEANDECVPRSIVTRVPMLLRGVATVPRFHRCEEDLSLSTLGAQDISTTGIASRRTLVVANVIPRKLSRTRSAICALVTNEVLRTFSPPYRGRLLLVRYMYKKLSFHSHSAIVTGPN